MRSFGRQLLVSAASAEKEVWSATPGCAICAVLPGKRVPKSTVRCKRGVYHGVQVGRDCECSIIRNSGATEPVFSTRYFLHEIFVCVALRHWLY